MNSLTLPRVFFPHTLYNNFPEKKGLGRPYYKVRNKLIYRLSSTWQKNCRIKNSVFYFVIFGKKHGAIVVLTFLRRTWQYCVRKGDSGPFKSFKKASPLDTASLRQTRKKKDFSEFLLREKKRRYIFTAEKAITKSSSFLSLGEKTRDFPEKAGREKRLAPRENNAVCRMCMWNAHTLEYLDCLALSTPKFVLRKKNEIFFSFSFLSLIFPLQSDCQKRPAERSVIFFEFFPYLFGEIAWITFRSFDGKWGNAWHFLSSSPSFFSHVRMGGRDPEFSGYRHSFSPFLSRKKRNKK